MHTSRLNTILFTKMLLRCVLSYSYLLHDGASKNGGGMILVGMVVHPFLRDICNLPFLGGLR